MRHFQRLAQNLPITPLLHAVQRQPELWNQNTLRTTHEKSPHTEVDDIWLRFNDMGLYEETGDPAKILDEHESICYPAWFALPQAHPFIFDLMTLVRGFRLGRVLITRLAPGKKITPHVDGGSHAAYYDRYHLLLQCEPGVVFGAELETPQMRSGELWWFDNAKEHFVYNNSNEDRLTMIIDVRTQT